MKNFIRMMSKSVLSIDFRLKRSYTLEEILRCPKYKIYKSTTDNTLLVVFKSPVRREGNLFTHMVVEHNGEINMSFYNPNKSLEDSFISPKHKFEPYFGGLF